MLSAKKAAGIRTMATGVSLPQRCRFPIRLKKTLKSKLVFIVGMKDAAITCLK